ncbi:hypothetical protein [Methylobacterium sp. SI9]|uniref:hypothetical protein n=1 Tax=Methylobacterium guangdongense TaxID=3138811 RepID=UPI00313D926C
MGTGRRDAGGADTLGQTAPPSTLPPGTVDLGDVLSLLATYTGQGAVNPERVNDGPRRLPGRR